LWPELTNAMTAGTLGRQEANSIGTEKALVSPIAIMAMR
jgi:hypothetical protein